MKARFDAVRAWAEDDDLRVVPAEARLVAPGKVTRTARLRPTRAVQRREADASMPRSVSTAVSNVGLGELDEVFAGALTSARSVVGEGERERVVEVAAAGVRGSGSALPHLDTVQRAFGHHDVSGIRAHLGQGASAASRAIGALAYATGEDVAFATAPDLFTVAHEAAHVVQQRAGANIPGGVGAAGDEHERHADEVAAAVVAGRSAVPLLDRLGPAVHTPTGAVQRRGDGVDARAGIPNTSREVVIVSRGKGAAQVTFKVKLALGDTAAASAHAGGERWELALKALEPKASHELSGFATRLKAALFAGEFSLDVFEGIAIALKLSGPEASLDSKGPELTVAKVSISGKGDATRWLADSLPPELAGRVKATVILEGSYAIGGKLLARLADLDRVGRRLAGHLDKLERVTDHLERLGKAEAELLEKRAAAETKRRVAMQVTGKARRGAPAKLVQAADRELRAIEGQLQRVRSGMHAGVARAQALERVVARDARKLAKVEKGLDGKIGKALFRRFGAKFGPRAAKLVSKLVPVLNSISLASDIADVIQLIQALRAGQLGLSLLGDLGGDGGDGGDGGGDEGPTDAGVPAAPGDTDADTGGDASRAAAAAAPVADPAGSADAGTAAGAGQGPDAGTEPDVGGHVANEAVEQALRALHPTARALVEALRRTRAIELDADQLHILAQMVPEDLDQTEAATLIQRLAIQGGGARDVYELLAKVEQAVADLHDAEEPAATGEAAALASAGHDPVAPASAAPPPAGPTETAAGSVGGASVRAVGASAPSGFAGPGASTATATAGGAASSPGDGGGAAATASSRAGTASTRATGGEQAGPVTRPEQAGGAPTRASEARGSRGDGSRGERGRGKRGRKRGQRPDRGGGRSAGADVSGVIRAGDVERHLRLVGGEPDLAALRGWLGGLVGKPGQEPGSTIGTIEPSIRPAGPRRWMLAVVVETRSSQARAATVRYDFVLEIAGRRLAAQPIALVDVDVRGAGHP